MRNAIAACVCSVLLNCSAFAKDVWIDTDPAIGSPIREVDDGFALVLAFHSPELRIAGITTSYGNAPLQQTTRVARELADRFGATGGVSSGDVFPGAASRADLGRPTAAIGALNSATRERKLTYIALGPLTNLATAIQRQPEITLRIDEVIMVGGRSPEATLKLGKWMRIHDANVFKDPAAVRVVLESRLPVTVVPIESASATALTGNDFRQLQGASPSADFLFRNSRVWFWFWTSVASAAAAPVFDANAVLCAARPELADTESRRATVASSGELVVTRDSGRIVKWCRSFMPSAKAMMLRRLRERVK